MINSRLRLAFLFLALLTSRVAVAFGSSDFILVLDPPASAIAEASIPGTDSLWLARAHNRLILAAQQHARVSQAPALDRLAELEKAGMASSIRTFWVANAIALECDAELADALRDLPGVRDVQPNIPIELVPVQHERVPQTPLDDGVSDALISIRAPQAWQLGLTGSGVLVSNFDSGVHGNNIALLPRWRGNNGYPAAQCWFDLVEPLTATPGDNDGHGTETMGILCGMIPGDTIGVAWNAQYIAAAVAEGGSTILNALEAFEWVIDPDGNPATFEDVPRVLSNSWGFSGGIEICNNVLFQAMDLCTAAGTAIVWAAGNEGPGASSIRNPANRADSPVNAFAVGGWNDGTSAVWVSSSRGPSPCSMDTRLRIKPEVVAPSVGVRTTVGGSTFLQATGTSFCAPLAAGTIALMVEANPLLPADSLLELLLYTSSDVDAPGLDNNTGYGKIDALMACQAALTGLGWAHGTVQSNLGLPVDAEVLVLNYPQHTTTDTSGIFRQALPCYLPFQLQVVASGFVPQTINVSTIPEDTAYYSVTLTPTAQGILTGNVVDCFGFPEEDAIVSALGSQVPPVFTDQNGRFLMTLNPGDYSVACSSATCNGTVVPDVEIFPGAITDIEIVLTLNPAFLCSPPDNYGYFLCDNNDPGGPTATFMSSAWDEGGRGVVHNLADDGSVALGLPFPVTYYGQTYTRVFLNSNGIVSFVRASTVFNNAQLPYGSTPSLYPFWDDFSDPLGGDILSDYDPALGTYTLEFHELPYFVSIPPPTDSANFQVVFYDPEVYPSATGNTFAEFRYGRVDRNNGATIGIDRASNGSYVRYGHNGSWQEHAVPVMEDLTIRIADSEFPADAPSLHVEPSVLSLALEPGTTLDTSVFVYNLGSAALAYAVNTPSDTIAAFRRNERLPGSRIEFNDFPKGGFPTRFDRITASLDDPIPDEYGYAWSTSENDTSVHYEFFDIAGVGTNVGIIRDDTTSYPRDLPWEFRLYDRVFNQYAVCSNGFISLWSQVRNYTNDPMSSARDPYYLIAPLWMDLNPSANGQIWEYYDQPNDRFIVQWNEIPPFNASNSQNMTFQAIFYRNGELDFVYERLRGPYILYSAGIKGGGGDAFLQFSYNGSLVDSMMTIHISRPDTSDASLRILSGAQGVVPPQSVREVRVRFANNSLSSGTMAFPLSISSSDPDGGVVQLGCSVEGALPFDPRAVLQWDETNLILTWRSHAANSFAIWTALPGDSVFVPFVTSIPDTMFAFPLPIDPIRLYSVTLAGAQPPLPSTVADPILNSKLSH
ncbi:MAG: S8 family serine peptidase [Calditrichaeota bacterium]|nr:S8 family serine peptidase [Calditrichota bacterium]MCB9366054.1 S8 family serine peptidase [Calditrichota bacterium]MCB9391820.1 S8 family serine peptidase [Calditrichota bacterium]